MLKIVKLKKQSKETMSQNEVKFIANSEMPVQANSDVLRTPDVRLVTSLNLKRTFLTCPVKHAKFILADDVYREVVVAGIRYGVVWDEIMRALLDRELSSISPFSSLAPFLPD